MLYNIIYCEVEKNNNLIEYVVDWIFIKFSLHNEFYHFSYYILMIRISKFRGTIIP